MNAYQEWWKAQSRKGDPLRNLNIIIDAFYAGVAVGRKESQDDAQFKALEKKDVRGWLCRILKPASIS